MPEPGHVLADRYVLERLIAEGGMGAVWAARHRALEVPVAVKLMSEGAFANPTLRTRFEREAKVGARLRTPHAVQVYDYGLDGEVPFLTMELLEGEDLGEYGMKNAPFSLAETVTLLTQAARGLAAAHQEGVIHRDVKPSNLFIARVSAGQQIVKVLDFGIAKLSDEQKLTKTSVILGSPSFMSPEQVLGNPVGPRTDVWGLAVVAFWMLTGELPFTGPSAAEVSHRILTGDRPAPIELAPGLPDEIDDIFEKALAVDPVERYASPLHMMSDLSQIDRLYPNAAATAPPPEMATERRAPAILAAGPASAKDVATSTRVLETIQRRPARTQPLPQRSSAGGGDQKPGERPEPRTDPLVLPAEMSLNAPGAAAREPLVSEPAEPERRTTKRTRPPARMNAIWWVLPVLALVVVLVGLVVMLR